MNQNTPQPDGPVVAFVLATHNRCEVVLETLAMLSECGLARSEFEVVVVDNASTDGTPDKIAGLTTHLIRQRSNTGSTAKAAGIGHTSAPYIVFLDDDSYPKPGSIERMIGKFSANPKLGAAGFSVHLPDGSQESSALPGVFVGCGVGFRREALIECGGLDGSFFMQAEEYDLSFRLASAGWEVEVFADLAVDHLKTTTARKNSRTTYYDIRNNLRVAARHLPSPFHGIYRREYLLRYEWLAQHDGHQSAYRKGVVIGTMLGSWERLRYRNRLSAVEFERFFQIEAVADRMTELAATGIDTIVLAGFGKNIFAFHSAAIDAGIRVLAIADNRFAAPERHYRGTPIISIGEAVQTAPSAFVVSDMSPVHARRVKEEVSKKTTQTVYDWYGLDDENNMCQKKASPPVRLADDHRVASTAV